MSLEYREGDWFAVPLNSGGYGTVVIARAKTGVSVVLGYFFGPRFDDLPSLRELEGVAPQDAALIKRFGDLAVLPADAGGGGWPAIGRIPDWNRAAWPMPVFSRKEPEVFGGRTFLVEYPDDNPNGMPVERQVPPDVAADKPDDGMSGHVWVAKQLDKLLS